MRDGNQDLRITLIACLLTAVFEALHGNYSLANAQVRIGVDLLYEFKATFPKNRFTLEHESPNPNVVETDLCQTFGRLELTTVYPDDTIPLERHEARKSHEAESLRSMPEVFNSLQEARVYLEVLLGRLEHYYYALGVWPTETVFTDSPIDGESHRNLVRHTDKHGIPSEEPLEAQSQRLHTSANYHNTPVSHPDVYNDPSNEGMEALSQRYYTRAQHDNAPTYSASNENAFNKSTCSYEAEEGKVMREQHMKEILHWKSAFESLMARSDMSESSSSTLLRLHSKTSYMCLLTFSTTDLMMYDKFVNELWDIVYLAKQLIGTSSPSQKSKFTLDFGAIVPLYFVGIKCRDSAVRKVDIELLLAKPRKEGFWDSQLIGRIIDGSRKLRRSLRAVGRYRHERGFGRLTLCST